MAGTQRRAARHATRVVSSALPEMIGRRVLEAIDEGVEKRWKPARRRAAAIEADTVEARVIAATASFRREVGAAGAAAGGTAALPGVGTATSAATFAVELGWTTLRLTDLILTVGAIHGHRAATVEERRLWVLSVLAYGSAATTMVSRLAREMGMGLGRQGAGPIPAETLLQLNRALATNVLARYGTRRGAAAMSRLVPFGIGAVLGYGLNSYTVKATARDAHAYFAKLPPPRDDSIETSVRTDAH